MNKKNVLLRIAKVPALIAMLSMLLVACIIRNHPVVVVDGNESLDTTVLQGGWEMKSYVSEHSYYKDSMQTVPTKHDKHDTQFDGKAVAWLFRNNEIYHFQWVISEPDKYWSKVDDAAYRTYVIEGKKPYFTIVETADYDIYCITDPCPDKIIKRYSVNKLTNDELILIYDERITYPEAGVPSVNVVHETYTFVRERSLDDWKPTE